MIYHPSTGLCVIQDELTKGLRLGNCLTHNYWTYTPENSLTLRNSPLCLEAVGWDQSPILTDNCVGTGNTTWIPISESKLHLSATLSDGQIACLEVDYIQKTVFTAACKCLSGDQFCNPMGQWFKIITAPDVLITTSNVTTSVVN